MSLVIFIFQSLLRSLSSSESRSIVKVDKFDENLPEVINQINQLSYKTFSDLPRGEELIDHFTINHATGKMLILQNFFIVIDEFVQETRNANL